jgi:curved DNA-binding protein CbpA
MATIGTGNIDFNPYARLGLAPGASLADVKRAYRRLALHFHPDHAGPGSLPTFMAVKTAYEWIVAHHSRADVGRRRPGRESRPTVARSVRHAPPMATRPAPASASRSSWSGGRWYWEGMRARAARG